MGNRQSAEESRQSPPSSQPRPPEESRQSPPSSSTHPLEHLRRRGSFTYLPPDLEESRQSTPSSSPCPSEESRQSPPSSSTHPLEHLRRGGSFTYLPPDLSELRVVLLGNSCSERSSVGNIILRENKFNTEEEPDRCQRVRGQWKEKEIVLINTPDLLHPNISEDKLTEHVENCVRLSDPGPHVFLLVLQPEDLNKGQKLRLRKVLKKFSDRSFDHSLVLISTPREEQPGFMEQYRQHPPLKDVIRECSYRFLWRKDLELQELLTRLGQIVKENNGEHLNLR